MAPNRQHHRGQHPEDALLFAEDRLPSLRDGTHDLSCLYGRGYAEKSALKIVGDRYQFDVHQRTAIQRAACAEADLERRQRHAVDVGGLAGQPLAIDGYNLLITIECALSGGILILGRDGCIRDMASLHGSYRKVEETQAAAARIGEALAQLAPGGIRWYLDKPVSNSGRLRALLLDHAGRAGWDWEVELANHVDPLLAQSPDVVVTADSWILDRVARWTNLAAHVEASLDPPARVIDLSG